MNSADRPSFEHVSLPDVRGELLACLRELEADDPRVIWSDERKAGLVSGIDQVFHFFFDDHDFDESALGVVLTNEREICAIDELKRALEAVLDAVGDAGDDEFVEHPLWPLVRSAAASTVNQLHASR